jgi:hypothetical protein
MHPSCLPSLAATPTHRRSWSENVARISSSRISNSEFLNIHKYINECFLSVRRTRNKSTRLFS